MWSELDTSPSSYLVPTQLLPSLVLLIEHDHGGNHAETKEELFHHMAHAKTTHNENHYGTIEG